jgi:segregation and condensation protein B
MTTVTESETQQTLVDVPRAPLRPSLEAVLMVADQPLDAVALAAAVGHPVEEVVAELQLLAEDYDEQGRGFELRMVAGGWRLYTRADCAPYVERFVVDGQQARLTQAALETLAVVAYKQPVSRARVSAIRGVNVDGVMRTLVSRGLVEEAGADTESQAILYRTTSYFLERMGMQSLDDLPELAPYLPEMDDMEEELAAQAAADAAPPTPSEEPAEQPAQQPLVPDPTDDAGTADAGPVADVPGAEADATPDDGEAVTSDIGAVAADPEVLLTTEDAAADPGIDGDLSTDEPSDLDLEHTPEDLDPSDEVESAEEELEPAEELEAAGEVGVDEEVDLAEIPEVVEDGAAGVAADDEGTGTASERVERRDG